MFKKSAKSDTKAAATKTNSRFGKLATTTIFGLIAAAVVAYLGWAIYSYYHHKTPAATTVTNTAAPTSPTTGVKSAADPYKGWQQFCDSQYHFCFKYPASGWSLQSSVNSSKISVATLTNTSKNVTISYTNPQTSVQKVSFTTVSLSPLILSNVPFKVVGGFAASSYAPSYSVGDPLTIQTNKPTPGATAQFPVEPTFVDIASNGHNAGSLQATANGKFASAAAAKAWFETAQAQTSLKILQSTSYQPTLAK
ncbi:MAG: hypothetical protein ACREGF_01530 [Candidatus Saccharimonadales bacterium]